MRGKRLIDLALNAIDIIDRNLYERTCDVRWWATDAAVVACVADRTPETAQHAGRRLRVILEAYTVYLDLWICDAAGQVLATGRPERYPGTRSLSVAREPWFIGAMRLPSGDDFVADDIRSLRVLNDAPVATFATAIRENGASTGKPLGVLGIHFDWKPQAQAVVNGVRLTTEERQRCRIMILDRAYRVLAASDGKGSPGRDDRPQGRSGRCGKLRRRRQDGRLRGDTGVRNLQRHGLVRLPDPKQGGPGPLMAATRDRWACPILQRPSRGPLASTDTITIVMISTHIGAS